MKITITAITEWEEDERLMAGDASHEGQRAVQRMLEEERVAKEDNEWTTGLPFTCEARDLEHALEKYNRKFCEYDYLQAVDADWEEAEDEESKNGYGVEIWTGPVSSLTLELVSGEASSIEEARRLGEEYIAESIADGTLAQNARIEFVYRIGD